MQAHRETNVLGWMRSSIPASIKNVRTPDRRSLLGIDGAVRTSWYQHQSNTSQIAIPNKIAKPRSAITAHSQQAEAGIPVPPRRTCRAYVRAEPRSTSTANQVARGATGPG